MSILEEFAENLLYQRSQAPYSVYAILARISKSHKNQNLAKPIPRLFKLQAYHDDVDHVVILPPQML
jgi:hypothetical protein